MNKYENGKIYKIVCKSTGLQYFGSTCEKRLCNRLSKHKYEFMHDRKYSTSHEILQHENYHIELVEMFPCKSKDELIQRERFYIQNNECVNKYVPGRSGKEYYADNREQVLNRNKIYRKKNKDKISNKKKIYSEKNKEKLLIYHKKYYELKKEEISEKNKIYREKNKEMIKIKKHEYSLKNKDKKREYDRKRRETLKAKKSTLILNETEN